MTTRIVRLVALCGFLMAGAGVGLQAHHSLAGVYDLAHEVVLVGTLEKLNFTNPHSSIELNVQGKDGSITKWTLVTASNTVLTRQGVTKSSIPASSRSRPRDDARVGNRTTGPHVSDPRSARCDRNGHTG